MKTEHGIGRKTVAAEALVRSCISPVGEGIWASADARYAHQLWTRDLALAAGPALRLIGCGEVAEAQLAGIRRRQRADGKVPILFLDDPDAFVRIKEAKERETGKPSFMLNAYRSAGGVEHCTPWTKDCEYLFVVALYEAAVAAGRAVTREEEEAVDRALAYVVRHNMADGLVVGADWRDTNVDLADVAVLSNNCLYFHALMLAGRRGAAQKLGDRINQAFWTEKGYRDYLKADTPDAFGLALGVLYGIFPRERLPCVIGQLASFRTPYGYLANDCRPNPTSEGERRRIDAMARPMVIWPFVHGYVVQAFARLGHFRTALQALAQYGALDGFREYYFPETGHGGGAEAQMWSAARYLVCGEALFQEAWG